MTLIEYIIMFSLYFLLVWVTAIVYQKYGPPDDTPPEN
jgi:hypothetical protein